MQEYTILATKLFSPPVRSEWVSRPRLVQRLHESLGADNTFTRKLTLISAPAGFGKTTLVTEWLETLKKTFPKVGIAWFSLDDGDNDLARFLNYMIAAILQCKQVDSRFGNEALNMLQSPQPHWESILTSLINEFMLVDQQMVFVFDDYHVIYNEQVHDALSFLIQHQPSQLHLVFSTRQDPLFQLARMRVRRMTTEIRASDLRFTPSEVSAFLSKVLDNTLTQADIAALEQRTEGWIAGLQLAALSMRNVQDVSAFVRSFTGSHRFVLDYLIEEVLSQQSEAVQMFLLQTSILDRMTGSLCDALTGQDNGQATLEILENANLFIVPLDNERRWYRYHHLFANLLVLRLNQTQQGQQPVLLRYASEWHEANGTDVEAIDYALRAKDYSRAAALIEARIEALWGRGENTKLKRWLDELPEEVLSVRPYIHIFLARLQYLSGQLNATERSLKAIEKAIAAIPVADPDIDKLQGRTAVVWAGLYSFQADAPKIIHYANQALQCLPQDDYSWRGSAALLLGNAYDFSGNISAGYTARLEALDAFKAVGDRYYILVANQQMATTLRAQGRLQQTIALCEQQWQFANEVGLSETNIIGWLLAVWGETLAELGDLESAITRAQQGCDLAEKNGAALILGACYSNLIRILYSKGDFVAVEALSHKTKATVGQYALAPWANALISAWQARAYLAQGKLDAANQWAVDRGLIVGGEFRGLDKDSNVGSYDYLVLARLLIAQGQLDATERLLRLLYEMILTTGRTSIEIELACLLALLYQAQGDIDQAFSLLQQALSLAEPNKFISIFVDEGQLMAKLLYEALIRGITPDYCGRLLAAFPDTNLVQTRAPVAEAPGSELIEPLTEREIQILQLIAEGMTNPEIAARLFLALNTVKAHTRNIYGKLGVNNRTQAASRAKGLGIVNDG